MLGGETLLMRAARTAVLAGFKPVIASLRDERWAPALRHLGVRAVVNGVASQGIASAVRLGIAALAGLDLQGAVVMTCDQPLLRVEHLRALCAQPERLTGSAYAGRVGVPAYFPAAVFPELLQLRGDAGARALLQGAASVADEDLALDIDTEEDLRRAEQHFGLPSA